MKIFQETEGMLGSTEFFRLKEIGGKMVLHNTIGHREQDYWIILYSLLMSRFDILCFSNSQFSPEFFGVSTF